MQEVDVTPDSRIRYLLIQPGDVVEGDTQVLEIPDPNGTLFEQARRTTCTAPAATGMNSLGHRRSLTHEAKGEHELAYCSCCEQSGTTDGDLIRTAELVQSQSGRDLDPDVRRPLVSIARCPDVLAWRTTESIGLWWVRGPCGRSRPRTAGSCPRSG